MARIQLGHSKRVVTKLDVLMNAVTVLKTNALIGAEEVKVLKESLFKGFTDPEVNYCVAVCNQLNLSPLLKHIHFVKRTGHDGKSAIATQTGIDGLRLSAQRSGEYAGSDRPVFEGTSAIPEIAVVTVHRIVAGQRVAFTGEATWSEFYPKNPKNRAMWDQMPKNQLAKCAEAQALRKGFPAECSSMYIDEEMHQADGPSKAEQVQSRVMPKEPSIETTATHVEAESSEAGEPPEDTREAHVCTACGKDLVKSKTKPVMYCVDWQDDSKGKHSKVYLD